MNHPCRFSHNTQVYLETFSSILEEMIQGMTGAELTDSISHNFIVQMVPHHRAAIEMSRNVLNYTTNVELQEIARRIISEQTKSIENMEQILCRCGTLENTQPDLCTYQSELEQIMQTMFCEMRHACSTNRINTNFLREMIPHHMGAIRMSRTALRYPICSELRPILQAIITSQENGVQQMGRLLRRLTCGRN